MLPAKAPRPRCPLPRRPPGGSRRRGSRSGATADWISPYEYDYQHFGNIAEPPSAEFPLGTDLVGRDMLSRMIYGARVSMAVALVSQIVILLIAVPIGAIAGFYG